jgi:HAD superfamily hydrolase (TIGR01509 family)
MIRNIIFDLGNVLVNVEYARFQRKIFDCGVDEQKYNNFFRGGSYRLLGYESGEISSDEFVTRCITGLELKLKPDEFSDAFNDMFSEIKPMSEIVKKLAEEGKYNLFLLSNTSPLHFEFIKQKYEFVNLLHKFGLSYEMKALKPESVIYQKAIEHLGIKPEESLFIDDLKENCEGAEKFGIKTICYDKNNHADFEKQFDKLLNNS